MKKFIPLGIIFLVVFLLYYQTLSVYFSQDDFFMFKVSQSNGTLGGFLNLLAIHPFAERGLAFYRPIFREALHNIYFLVFGLNPLFFRILLLLIHFTNIFLVYTFVKQIFKNAILAFFVAFFFGITAANVSLLYYLAGGIEAGGATMFALITLILYQKYLFNNKFKFFILSFFTFLLAIFSHEIVISISAVMLILFLTSTAKRTFHRMIHLLPFFLATAILIYIDLVKIGLSPGESQYHFMFNIKSVFNSITWYSLWALGLPETLIDFLGPGLKLNPVLMRYWGNYYVIIFTACIIALVSLAAATFYLFLKSKKVFSDRRFWFFLLWFPIGLAPVIFLPAHKSTHYLIFVLPAFWTLIGFIVFNFYSSMNKVNVRIAVFITCILTIALMILSITSIKLEDNTYWAASRGRLAEKIIKEVKNSYPVLPKGAVVYFKNDPNYPYLTKEWGGTSKQTSLVLNGSDALQLLYNDPTLKVYYEDLGSPKDTQKNIYQIIAKIN